MGYVEDSFRCKYCKYRSGLDKRQTCDYIIIEQHRRGCSVDNCDKFVPINNKVPPEAYSSAKPAAALPVKSKSPYEAQYRKLYNQGKTDRQIADTVGVTLQTVSAWRQRRGLPIHPDTSRQGKGEEYRKLYDQGLTDSEIADKTGRAPSTVSWWRLKQGLPPNKK